MMIRGLSLGLLMGALALAGCGGDSSSSAGAAEGEACQGGGNCAAKLFCLYKTKGDKTGVCTAVPAACSESAKCSDPCFDEAKKACTSMSSACITVGTAITHTCQ